MYVVCTGSMAANAGAYLIHTVPRQPIMSLPKTLVFTRSTCNRHTSPKLPPLYVNHGRSAGPLSSDSSRSFRLSLPSWSPQKRHLILASVHWPMHPSRSPPTNSSSLDTPPASIESPTTEPPAMISSPSLIGARRLNSFQTFCWRAGAWLALAVAEAREEGCERDTVGDVTCYYHRLL